MRAFLHTSIESMDSNSYKRYPPLLLSVWVPLYLLMVLERQKKSIKERYLIPSVLRAGAQRLRPLLGQIVALVAPSLLRHLDCNQTTSYPESLSRKRQVIRHHGPHNQGANSSFITPIFIHIQETCFSGDSWLTWHFINGLCRTPAGGLSYSTVDSLLFGYLLSSDEVLESRWPCNNMCMTGSIYSCHALFFGLYSMTISV